MRLLSLSEVSIQKRTSPDKFTGKLGIRDLDISFAFSLVLAFKLTGQCTQYWSSMPRRARSLSISSSAPRSFDHMSSRRTTRRIAGYTSGAYMLGSCCTSEDQALKAATEKRGTWTQASSRNDLNFTEISESDRKKVRNSKKFGILF